jgi:hypothetical protein
MMGNPTHQQTNRSEVMWKVYDYMEGQDGNPRFQSRCPTVYGPLPRKRWVPVKGERYKVKHKVTNGSAKVGSGKDYTAAKAVQYAEWLARRDGVVIPENSEGVALWSSVPVPNKAKPEPRVYAVNFYQKRSHWHRKREGLGEALLTVTIPNWDWVPQVTEEHGVDSLTSWANSLTSEQACRLINIASPLTDEERVYFDAMSDDELLAELQT